MGGLGCKRDVLWATRACWPAGVAWEGRGACGRHTARVTNWRLQCEFESNARRVQRPTPSGPPQGRLVQAWRWSPTRSLWLAGLDGGSVARSGRLRAIRAAYLRTGVLSTVYTAPVLARVGAGGAWTYVWTCAAQSCHGAVVIPAYLLHFLLYPLSFTFLLLLLSGHPFLPLDSFPPPESKKISPSSPAHLDLPPPRFFCFPATLPLP